MSSKELVDKCYGSTSSSRSRSRSREATRRWRRNKSPSRSRSNSRENRKHRDRTRDSKKGKTCSRSQERLQRRRDEWSKARSRSRSGEDRRKRHDSRSRECKIRRSKSRETDRRSRSRESAGRRTKSRPCDNDDGHKRRHGRRSRSRDLPEKKMSRSADEKKQRYWKQRESQSRDKGGGWKTRHHSGSDSTNGSPSRGSPVKRFHSRSVSRSASRSDSRSPRRLSRSSSPRGRGAGKGNEERRTISLSEERLRPRSSENKRKKDKRKHKSEKKTKKHSRSRSRSSSVSSTGCHQESREASPSNRKDQLLQDWLSRHRRSPSRNSMTSVSSESPTRDAAESHLAMGTTMEDAHVAREELHKQKEMMKALEAPEEKRARRLAKKEAKERRKRKKMGWSEEYMGYTNADNPFGDNNLLGTFKWQKALEKKGISHLGEKELKDRNKHIQEENRRELQKVKQLRLEREREKAMREQELEMLQREKEAEHFKTWAEQEDNFHLHQAKLRSKIRIRDGRAKPIDLLAKYISAEDDDLAVEMHEPYTFLTGLTVSDMDDLLEDIKVYMELEQGKNVDFWRDMTTITEDEINKLRKLEASGKGPGDRREGINTSVTTDVQGIFKGKTFNQLQALHQNIECKIRAGGSNLDIGYWESLLQQVKVYMARARLRERHQDVLRQKLYKLKKEQGVESEPLFPIVKQESPSSEGRSPSSDDSSTKGSSLDLEDVKQESEQPSVSGGAEAENETEQQLGDNEVVLTEEDLIQQSLDDYDSGRYSPCLLQQSELPLDTHVVEPEEDLHRLQLARKQLQVTGDASESAEDAFVRRAKEGMGGDEAQFSVEMPLSGKVYLWADKYRPRKPRFFNRVHTGFEWNKYNQTHYDFDNPPPKIVQGYKFNIFYPDLIDKRSTPQYFLEPCADNKDFAVLRFHAGPPYEDIAFKIVNREWEYSHRHGFRCQFANGIFQLWFHFKSPLHHLINISFVATEIEHSGATVQSALLQSADKLNELRAELEFVHCQPLMNTLTSFEAQSFMAVDVCDKVSDLLPCLKSSGFPIATSSCEDAKHNAAAAAAAAKLEEYFVAGPHS
ncbi:CATIN protein, partial [Polypterus senegalus]